MKKEKIFMIISISIFILCLIGSTYALYKKTLSSNVGINTNTPGLDEYIIYEKGNDITGTLNASTTYMGGISSNIKFYKKDNTYDIYGKIELTINSIGTNLSNSNALKYALVNNGNVLREGSLNGVSVGSKITIINNLFLETTEQIYTIYVWLDINEQLGNISGESLNISVDCTAEMVPAPTLAYTITSLYNNADKTTVTNNSIEYNYATSVSLMNDRLGGTTTDYDGGNIRYYGASPNNYIYFNCSDYSNQTSDTCELWRIIGVFDGKVKIIRNSNIGSLAWDQDKNIDSSLTTYDNDWSTSSLQVLLNEKYYNGNTIGTITYYSGSSGETSTSLNLANIGIKNDTTRNLISTETYYLRGYNSNSVYVDAMYNYERTTGSVYNISRPTSWNGKIALAYPSDYGYAADFNYCTFKLDSYSASPCTSNNWMNSILGTSSHSWLMTPNSNNTYNAWIVYSSGVVTDGHLAYFAYEVAPALSLNSELVVETGTGESTNPYQLAIG